jgi:acyl-CoA synthetase (AMP-forming)/AMP-acid ligase II
MPIAIQLADPRPSSESALQAPPIVWKMNVPCSAQLASAAKTVAAGLIEQDVLPGDRVALMLPTGAEFFAAFFGTLYAGAVPVPIYPPMQLSQLEDYLRRQA